MALPTDSGLAPLQPPTGHPRARSSLDARPSRIGPRTDHMQPSGVRHPPRRTVRSSRFEPLQCPAPACLGRDLNNRWNQFAVVVSAHRREALPAILPAPRDTRVGLLAFAIAEPAIDRQLLKRLVPLRNHKRLVKPHSGRMPRSEAFDEEAAVPAGHESRGPAATFHSGPRTVAETQMPTTAAAAPAERP
jgi:hypothetical protein